MTELIQHQPAEITYGPPLGTQLIAAAVEQMAGAHQLGQALAGTAFVPRHFQGKPDDVTAAIMYGAAIGLDPMSAVRSIYVVSGTPGLYARSMVAVAMSKGHKIWTEETTDEAVTVAGQRRGSEVVERVTWTIERARKAGYTSNAKYSSDPQAMLWARAAGDVARRIAPDALAGLDYSVEELQVIDHVDVPARPRRESAADLIGSVPTVKVPVGSDGVAPAFEVDSPAGSTVNVEYQNVPTTTKEEFDAAMARSAAEPMATQRQLTAIRAGMADLGRTDRAEVLTVVSEMVRRPLGSSKELTRDEAGTVLDAIKEEVERNQRLADAAPEQPELPVDGGEA